MSTMQFVRAFSVVTALAGAALAQSSGSITGAIKDSKSGVIPNVTVVASNPSQGVLQTATTNA